MIKSKHIEITLSAQDIARIKREAKRRGLSASSFLRSIYLEWIDRQALQELLLKEHCKERL